MAEAVEQAIRERKHLVAEAGTGVGKSFAYLVPAILAATEPRATGDGEEDGNDGETKSLSENPKTPTPNPSPEDGGGGSRKSAKNRSAAGVGNGDEDEDRPPRVVISTHTISLQEQLIGKDLPLLNSVIPREFAAVLVKGRGNYISLRRLDNALARAGSLFYDDGETEQLRDIRNWSKQTHDGSLSDLGYRPLGNVWDEVASDTSNCLGRKCKTYGKCFYYRARRRVQNAQVLIVNHALLFSDLALRRAGASILPDYDVLVLDEAHTVEAVAGDHLGVKVTSGQVEYTLNKLYNDRTNKGLLVHKKLQKEQLQVDACRHTADTFFGDLLNWHANTAPKNGRVHTAEVVPNRLSDELQALSAMVGQVGMKIEDASERQDYTAARDRLRALAGEIELWRLQKQEGSVYWLESYRTRRGYPRLTLAAAPIDIGPAMREELFERVPTVVMTSATLEVGGGRSKRFSVREGEAPAEPKPTVHLSSAGASPSPHADPGNFAFFQSRVGLTQCASLCVGSPFAGTARSGHGSPRLLSTHTSRWSTTLC